MSSFEELSVDSGLLSGDLAPFMSPPQAGMVAPTKTRRRARRSPVDMVLER
jgi:hypothetical protein